MGLTWEGVLNTLDPLFLGPIITGITDNQAAKDAEKLRTDPPKFEIPKSYDDYVKQMKERSQQQMPGFDAMKTGIEEAAAANATGVGQLESGPEAIMGMNDVYGEQTNQLRDLGMRASAWQNEQQLGYQQAVQGRGVLEQQQFDYNEWLPWQIKKNEIASMRNAGNQMVSQGSDAQAAAGMNIVSSTTSNIGK